MNETKHCCWNWARDETSNERVLYINGPIDDECWAGNETTPLAFKSELNAGTGDITVWIRSPGGNVFSATEMYNALKEYPGRVTIKIDTVAASSASIVAMAGDTVMMSPASWFMLHNPSTIAIGDGEEMLRAKSMLDGIRDGIITIYAMKSGLSRAKIGKLMDDESWLDARQAVDMGFCDGILYTDDAHEDKSPAPIYSRATVMNSILSKMPKAQKPPEPPPPPTGTPLEPLMQRLLSISH